MAIIAKLIQYSLVVALSVLLLSGCNFDDPSLSWIGNILSEELAPEGDANGTDNGGTADGGMNSDGEDGSDGEVEALTELEEWPECEVGPRCGMATHNPDLPCAAIDGGICVEGCCEPGLCQGPNQAFYEAIGSDCPQGADQDGCCIRGESDDEENGCEDGPKCRDDHPSGFDLPCIAINGGECVDGCCVAGPCQGPTCEFLEAMGDECEGTCDEVTDCCLSDDGEGNGEDGVDDGGNDDGGSSV